MTRRSPTYRLRKSDWPLGLLAVSVLLVYFFYTFIYLFQTPYPGFDMRTVAGQGGWDPDLEGHDGLIVAIGKLTFGEYERSWDKVPFQGFEPGDKVTLLFNDQSELEWRLPPPDLSSRVRRLINTVTFLPFWLAGTAVLLFLRPRDRRWALFAAFHYLTAIWFVTGSVAEWQIGGSRQALRSTMWLMVPVYLHLHLIVPSSLFDRLARIFMPFLYTAGTLLAFAQLLAPAPTSLPLLALVLAIVVSFSLLLYRLVSRSSPPATRIATRLMLAGIGFAFGPGIFWVLFQSNSAAPGLLLGGVVLLAIPVLPLFYLYAIYKRQLGVLEFRANRLLSLYTFILIYPPLYLLLFIIGGETIDSSEGRTLFNLAISSAFVIATPPLLTQFRRMVDRLAYGTEHNPDDIVRVFANRVPTALTREALVYLLSKEFGPSLLIRQSALYLFVDGELDTWYSHGLGEETTAAVKAHLPQLLLEAAVYQPPHRRRPGGLEWVRLVMPLKTRERTIGLWLFGRRDPDDFYPQPDIHLLQTLANQIAPAIENIRLYELLQKEAGRLADEVARRTAELRAERDRTQAILDGAGEGVFYTDPEGRVLYLNPAMTRLTGYTMAEAMGQTVTLWLEGDSLPETLEKMWTALRNDQQWSGELAGRRRNGSSFDLHLTVAPCHAPDGRLAGYVGILSDISRLKELDRLKSLFVSNVSHELRTPITNIKTYLTLLDRGRRERWDHYLLVVNKETQRLGRLIEDLLLLSRLDDKANSLNLAPTDVSSIVYETTQIFAARAEAKRITLQAQIGSPPPAALADAGQLDQVLTNLVANALAYTPEGGQVVVSAGPGQNGRSQMVWIKVA
ncbi:MAG: PAS domain-containing protein, partial [Chloroflexota bacterium]